jgi:hypothetical protein
MEIKVAMLHLVYMFQVVAAAQARQEVMLVTQLVALVELAQQIFQPGVLQRQLVKM